MKGNLYQHIKIRHAYDFSLCFPHELLMSFWIRYKGSTFNKSVTIKWYQKVSFSPLNGELFCIVLYLTLKLIFKVPP
jgi:hypothetical protein